MAVVCIVDRDEKSMNEILSFIKNSDLELEIHSFRSLEAFTAATHLYDMTAKTQKVVTKIDVLVLDYEACAKVEEDIKKIRRGLEIQQLQGEFPTRLLLTSFEKVKIPVWNLRIDDYIFKPLEKQLFLQKLQIAVAAPEKVEPSFLALQPIKEKIEVGKKSFLAFYNEYCLTIKNPMPLGEGAFVTFYSRRFSDGKIGKLLGRSLESTKVNDGYLCRFDYFGLSHNKQNSLRKRYNEIRKEDHVPLHVALTPLNHKPQAVIIDIDKNESHNLKQFLEENVEMNILHFPTYTNFLASCFPEESKAKKADTELKVKPAKATAFNVFFDINTELEIKKVHWESDLAEAQFLTYSKEEWEKRPDLFLKSIEVGQLEDFKTLIAQMANLAGKQSEKFIFTHSDGAKSLLLTDIEKVEDGFKVSFHDKTEEEPNYDYKNLGVSKINLQAIDIMFIDGNYIADPKLWLEGLTNKLQNLTNKKLPKIIILGKQPIVPHKFLIREFADYMQRPVDRALLGKKLLSSYSLGVSSLKSQQLSLSQLQQAQVNEEVMLATQIDMLSLSEFGISVRFGAPIRQDMFVQFYLKSFLGMDDYEPIYARCYFSEEDREFPGKFICYFTFLGVNDEVFTRIRLWMKEYYIKSKEAE